MPVFCRSTMTRDTATLIACASVVPSAAAPAGPILSAHEQVVQRYVGRARDCDEIHRALESPMPRKTELMILYAVMSGMPMKQMVRYATVPLNGLGRRGYDRDDLPD